MLKLQKSKKKSMKCPKCRWGGGGHRSSQNVPMLKCPKWPRGGRGQKTLGQCPKVYFFLKASLITFYVTDQNFL